jgi:hypothetical protein
MHHQQRRLVLRLQAERGQQDRKEKKDNVFHFTAKITVFVRC